MSANDPSSHRLTTIAVRQRSDGKERLAGGCCILQIIGINEGSQVSFKVMMAYSVDGAISCIFLPPVTLW